MNPRNASRRRLVTFAGDLLDRTSYKVIILIIALILVGSALGFWAFDATKLAKIGFSDALYFSIITFTSLGYGDVAPVGVGKLIAAIEVLAGLVSIAVLVGKLASERQAALLLLLYTSEHQRRITVFAKDIRQLDKKIDRALDDHERLYKYAKKLYKFLSSIHNYLRFQSNEGRLAAFGNTSTLRKLYKRIISLQKTAFDALQIAGTEQRTYSKLEQSLSRMASTSSVMLAFHLADAQATALLNEIQNEHRRLQSWNKLKAENRAILKYRSVITKRLLKRVEAALPAMPWERDIHKKIADELGIPKNLAERCVAIIKKTGNHLLDEHI